jgi:nitroreductase
MDAITAIMTRRSIRQYSSDPIPDSIITRWLEAAMAAPSSTNSQPWHFVVLTDRARLDGVPAFHRYAAMMPQAQAAILVCGDPQRSGAWVQDCAAATQNILLAAYASGLGAVWLGIHGTVERVAGIRELVTLPAGIEPLSLVALGYPAEQPLSVSRFNPQRVHRNRW